MPSPREFYQVHRIPSYTTDAHEEAKTWLDDTVQLANLALGNVELKIEISIYNEKKEKERTRTEQQNKYYHKLLDIIADYTGSDHRELHEELKHQFLAYPYVRGDKEYWMVKSTTQLTSKNFGEYLEKVFNWAVTEHDLVLPSSSDYY
jgi:hypothetical protein